jgi:hypothetical protein
MFEFNTLSIGAMSDSPKDDRFAEAVLIPPATPKSEPNLKSAFIFPANERAPSVQQPIIDPKQSTPVPPNR